MQQEKNVVLYTQPGWLFCHRTEKFLRENGIEFTTRDIIEDEEALAELERMGAYGTPVTVIDSDEVVFGFDQKKLKQLLVYAD